MRIAITIETKDRRPGGQINYLGETLRNLRRAGAFTSPHFAGLVIVGGGELPDFVATEVEANLVHPIHGAGIPYRFLPSPDGCTRQQNGARAIRAGAAIEGADWVLKLEDDLDVVDDFLGSTARWIAAHEAELPVMVSLGMALERVSVAHYEIPGESVLREGASFPNARKLLAAGVELVAELPSIFWGAQAVLFRRDDAADLAAWLGEDPYYDDGIEQHRERAHDLLLQRWCQARGAECVMAPLPSFVQHIGRQSGLSNPFFEFPWPGRAWHYGRREEVSISVNAKKRMLWVGDAGCPSGFARATHNILDMLRHAYDVTVLGMNYRGDPHGYPYQIWPCAPGGDYFGVGRLIWMCDMVKPDVIVLQNDGWNIPSYVQQMKRFVREYGHVPIVAVVAVDGKNFDGRWLDGVALAIFWTQFALDEARGGGYAGPAAVIPLGVDTSVYHPIDRAEARERQLPEQLRDAFIVGNVNRNQPRKRWDLMVKYFAKWITDAKIRDAYLYLHTAPTGDTGVDVRRLAAYYGVVDRLALVQPEVFYGVPESGMADTYNCFDVNASTSQGEGMGLTALESMACGVPQVLPDWAAYGDWAQGGARLVPCPTTHIGPPYVNVIGGIADEAGFIIALDSMYRDRRAREEAGAAALRKALEPRFRWADIGRRYVEALQRCLDERPHAPTEAELADLYRPEEVRV